MGPSHHKERPDEEKRGAFFPLGKSREGGGEENNDPKKGSRRKEKSFGKKRKTSWVGVGWTRGKGTFSPTQLKKKKEKRFARKEQGRRKLLVKGEGFWRRINKGVLPLGW